MYIVQEVSELEIRAELIELITHKLPFSQPDACQGYNLVCPLQPGTLNDFEGYLYLPTDTKAVFFYFLKFIFYDENL